MIIVCNGVFEMYVYKKIGIQINIIVICQWLYSEDQAFPEKVD